MTENTGILDLVGNAFRLWWREAIPLLLLNILWFAFQMPIVTAPIATAVVYAMARKVIDDDSINMSDLWQSLRLVALPALLWGALNLVVAAVVIGNFWIYRAEAGTIWAVVRVVWAGVGLGWFIVNLFYWPFWLAAEKPRLWSTLRNSAVFVVRRPAVGLVSIAILVGSLLLTLPFVAAAMTWVALLGLLAVDSDLKTVRASGRGTKRL